MNLWYRSELDNYWDEESKYRTDFKKRNLRRRQQVEMVLWSMEERAQDKAMNRRADATAKIDEENAKVRTTVMKDTHFKVSPYFSQTQPEKKHVSLKYVSLD